VMGLEEHLLGMFREDFEFSDEAGPSHLASHAAAPVAAAPTAQAAQASAAVINWDPEAEQELQKIPFFVRGKARRNTEKYAAEQELSQISIDTLYDAKAHYGR
ncbi:MAG: ferredoxin:protochlorophyllide reductase (ATP-dependent) subunit B, partial [Pseudomonadota bacterium]